ncbi:uncharacterized protein LOC116133021 [Pistacia vera]|uniref:uncharacterized protein LOC116133021 n=1 Tax=Pistacia vera TaxID=55513 RepID=UPI001262D98C|nr:uncharacterized protein LOC116133021 [Pistacia vera]
MSGGNSTPSSRNWPVGQGYGGHVPNSSEGSRAQAPFSQAGSLSFRADPGTSWDAPNPRPLYDERVITGPFSLAGFPVPSHSPVHILGMEVNPSHRQIIQASPPAFIRQQNVQGATHDDNSKLTREEQQMALKKLKKGVYDPPPMKIRPNLYYRLDSKNAVKEIQKEKENDIKSCAVCLEDFEPKETVMLTPCEHMFHEACIVPWVRSQGQCPVCRFVLSGQKRENDRVNVVAANDPFERELISVIRAIEEGTIWNSFARLYLT